ncbi:hypothetical protein ACFW9I_19575 [[Kitasatospora] papulosa]|uniref:hypothetical protein n=1 Tax=[Kitasatospora] papulosa TaxID=1464011 RepID=UPI00367BCB6D
MNKSILVASTMAQGDFQTGICSHFDFDAESSRQLPVSRTGAGDDKISSRQPWVASRAAERVVVSVRTEPEPRCECQDLGISQKKIDEEISSWQPEASENTVPTYPN